MSFQDTEINMGSKAVVWLSDTAFHVFLCERVIGIFYTHLYSTTIAAQCSDSALTFSINVLKEISMLEN